MTKRRRKKGAKNKTIQVLSEAILMAAEDVGEEKTPGHPDGKLVAYLAHVAIEEPVAFVNLLAKLLPAPSQAAADEEEESAPPVVNIHFE